MELRNSNKSVALGVYTILTVGVIILAVSNAPDEKQTGVVGKWGVVAVAIIIGAAAVFLLLPKLGLRFPYDVKWKEGLIPREKTESWSLSLLALLSIVFASGYFLPPFLIPFAGIMHLAVLFLIFIELKVRREKSPGPFAWYSSVLLRGCTSQQRGRLVFIVWLSVYTSTAAWQRLEMSQYVKTGIFARASPMALKAIENLSPAELFITLGLLWVSLLGFVSAYVYVWNIAGSATKLNRIVKVLSYVVESGFIGRESTGEKKQFTPFSVIFGLAPVLIFFVVLKLPEGTRAEVVAAVLLYALFYFGSIIHRIDRGEQDHLEQELKSAHEMQMGLMPKEDPQVKGFDISGVCVPANEVGGDFFDYVWLDQKKMKLGIALADVSGKAMKAAITAVMTSGMIYRELENNESPKSILRKINRPMYAKLDNRTFTALSFAVIDTKEKELRFSNAGQAYPILKRGGNVTALEVKGARLPLGVKEDVLYGEMAVKLKKGDLVVFYTDGIPEAKNATEEFYGFDRLKALVAGLDALSAREMRDRILDEVKAFTGPAPQHDDMTIVVVRVMA